MKLIDEVIDRLSIFKNLYDVIRIVDPISKEVLGVDDSHEKVKELHCYCFWSDNKVCDNCVSIRACKEDDTIVKLEYKEDKVFLITAIPTRINNNIYCVEIIKDISDKGQVKEESIINITNTKITINKMNDKIIKDELTGIYNRRFINERLPTEVNKSSLLNKPLSIIMADIDHFKNVNDNYGHIVGDKVLKDFAKLLKESIREKSDWVARYGGEEFLIVLNDANSDLAFSIAEKIRKKLEVSNFIYDNISINITSSFGVYSLSNDKVDIEVLISNADKNLYEAKRSGRNKTIVNV